MIMKKIKNLEDLRKSKGISQKYICDLMGFSRPTVKAKETRKSPVSIPEAVMFSQIYATDIEEIERLCRLK